MGGEKRVMFGGVGARPHRGSQEADGDKPEYPTPLWLSACKFRQVCPTLSEVALMWLKSEPLGRCRTSHAKPRPGRFPAVSIGTEQTRGGGGF